LIDYDLSKRREQAVELDQANQTCLTDF